MTGWVIIPVKSLVDGKSRLAEVLSPARRRRFNENALSHVIATVRDGFDAEHLLVVSGCAETRRFAEALGAAAIDEPRGGGLNRAVEFARDHGLAQGAERILIISSDLPLVTADEVRAVRDRARGEAAAVICRDRHGSGTNALYLTRPNGFHFAFGKASAEAHRAEAERLGLSTTITDLAGIGFDIDTPADVEALESSPNVGETSLGARR